MPTIKREALYIGGQLSNLLESGIAGGNEGLVTTEVAPFGGVKESSMGREGAHDGIEDYLGTKYISLGGLGQSPSHPGAQR